MSYEYYEHDEEEEELEQDIFDDTSMFRVRSLDFKKNRTFEVK